MGGSIQQGHAGTPPAPPSVVAGVGVVVIGRNEGQRLAACLTAAVPAAGGRCVYVDSGSTDGSPQLAQDLGAVVVALDMSRPFSAARARNAGVDRLLEQWPDLRFVQFVDGDCELQPGWIAAAAEALREDDKTAAVCGRLRERYRDATVYNRLCDIEWDGPVGEIKACGGLAMMRLDAFRQVGGFDPAVIAGEDDELCVRLRRAGYTIRRIDHEMALHDAAITRFGQWWRRTVRAGFGFAEGSAMHGRSPQRHWVKEARSNWAWGAVLPIVCLLLAWPTWGISLLALVAAYGLLWIKILRNDRRRGLSGRDARVHAFFLTIAKIPLALGQMRYWLLRLRGRRGQIIEYKRPTTPSPTRSPSTPAASPKATP